MSCAVIHQIAANRDWSSAHTDTLSIFLAMPVKLSCNTTASEASGTCLRLALHLPGTRPAECLAIHKHHVALIWTGSEILLESVSGLFAAASHGKSPTKSFWNQDEVLREPFVWLSLDGATTKLSISLSLRSPACQHWMAKRRLSGQTCEQAILGGLADLHLSLLTKERAGSDEGIAYEPWGAVYDRILPAE